MMVWDWLPARIVWPTAAAALAKPSGFSAASLIMTLTLPPLPGLDGLPVQIIGSVCGVEGTAGYDLRAVGVEIAWADGLQHQV